MIPQAEKELIKHIAAINRQILKYFESSITQITFKAKSIKFNGQSFLLSKYPTLKKAVEAEAKKLHGSIYATAKGSLKGSWHLSNKKNDLIVDKRLAGKKPNAKGKQILFDPNAGARDQFINRREKGLNLSQRIWNTLEPFKTEMEAGLGLGIMKGQSAQDMARDMKQYLKDPDKLFRRVRNAKGKLKLSKNAMNYHPGRGVYRSSYKNAFRLTRTENNMAYRTADFERWGKLPFVVGIEVRLSDSHPKYDICDPLAGKYPKDFHFRGWHPQCLCYAISILMSEEEYDKYEDQILAGLPVRVQSKGTITQTPEQFDKWLRENRERIAGWKNKPYWMKDNPKYVTGKPVPIPKPIQIPKAKPGKPIEPPLPIPPTGKLSPGGSSIKNQFTNIDRRIANPVDHALSMIDKVHGDGVLKDIPIKQSTSKTKHGLFRYSYAGQPIEIKISTRGNHKPLTFAHEMGHNLDFVSIGKGKFETMRGTLMKDFLEEAKKSDLIKNLQATLGRGKIMIDGVEVPLSFQYRKYIRYLLSDDEIWARSYAQFIAKRSGSTEMLAGVEKLNKTSPTLRVASQWTDKDFLGVEKAIEDLFLKLGWINQ